jgi:hypothetical protein
MPTSCGLKASRHLKVPVIEYVLVRTACLHHPVHIQ